MQDKKAVLHMYSDAEVFQSSILECRQAEHAAEVVAAEERARIHHKQKKVRALTLVDSRLGGDRLIDRFPHL